MIHRIEVNADNAGWVPAIIALQREDGTWYSDGTLAEFSNIYDACMELRLKEIATDETHPDGHNIRHRIVDIEDRKNA